MTSLPVVDEASAILGWEELRVLAFEALRTLVAMARVAAAFVFAMGATLAWPEVVLLAQLGGWVPHKRHPPGQQIMLRGLARLLDSYATQALVRKDPDASRRLLDRLFWSLGGVVSFFRIQVVGG